MGKRTLAQCSCPRMGLLPCSQWFLNGSHQPAHSHTTPLTPARTYALLEVGMAVCSSSRSTALTGCLLSLPILFSDSRTDSLAFAADGTLPQTNGCPSRAPESWGPKHPS